MLDSENLPLALAPVHHIAGCASGERLLASWRVVHHVYVPCVCLQVCKTAFLTGPLQLFGCSDCNGCSDCEVLSG